MHDGTKDIVNFSFLFPCLSRWNETLVEIVRQCNWGHIQKHRSPSSQFSNCSSNNMGLSAKGKRKVNVWASQHTTSLPSPPLPSPPLLSTPPLWAKAHFFSSNSSSRGGTGDVEWWTGVQALCCSALHWRRSLICITVPHIKHNPTHTHAHRHTHTHSPIHILLFHPYDCTASHMAAHTTAPHQRENVYLTSCLL